jgi:hypothetical protein
MDPTENLRRQRDLAERLLSDGITRDLEGDACELASLVLALDRWISRRGYLPRQWAECRKGLPEVKA